MLSGFFKPLLSSLVLPPMGPLLLAVLGALLVRRRRRLGMACLMLSLALLYALSCNAVAVWLARTAVPHYAPLDVATLVDSPAQAVVVLGGGATMAPEYGQAQPSAASAARLRYGVWLARQSNLPLAFSGGMGWSATSAQPESEADVAERVLQEDYGLQLRWKENQSRDTNENAQLTARMLQADHIQHIVLVTHATHMARSVTAFEREGLVVTPAPMGFVLPRQQAALEWIPSTHGLSASREVLHEWMGRAVGRLVRL